MTRSRWLASAGGTSSRRVDLAARGRVGSQRLTLPAVVLVVALAAVVLVASADAKPKKTKFVSKRYQYSLLLPGGSGGWLDAPATGNWSGDSPPNIDFDRLTDLKTGGFWLIAAKRVPQGMTLTKWTAYTMARATGSTCSFLPWRSKAKLGGAPARRYDLKCPEGRVIILAAVHAHRGYFYGCIPYTKTRLATQRACRAVQHSFHYTSG